MLKPVPVIAPAGQAATQVPQPWQRAGLISVTIDLRMEENGIERAQVVADAAARAFFFDHAGSHRFQCNLSLLDPAEHARCRSCTLRHAGGNIFRSLGAAGDKDAFGHRRNRVELRVLFDEPAVGAAGDAELLANFFGIMRAVPDRRTG